MSETLRKLHNLSKTWRPCSDFMDMLWRLISSHIIIINGHFCCFDCLLTVFDCFVGTNSVPIVKNSQKTVKTATSDHTESAEYKSSSAEYTKPLDNPSYILHLLLPSVSAAVHKIQP